MFRWHVDIKASILSAQIPGVGNVTDVNVVSRGLGGIASEVEVKGDGGSYKIKGQSQVRSMLGNTELVIKETGRKRYDRNGSPSKCVYFR